MFNAYSINII